MKINKKDTKKNLDIAEMAKIYAAAREDEDKRTYTNKFGDKAIDMWGKIIFIEKSKQDTKKKVEEDGKVMLRVKEGYLKVLMNTGGYTNILVRDTEVWVLEKELGGYYKPTQEEDNK